MILWQDNIVLPIIYVIVSYVNLSKDKFFNWKGERAMKVDMELEKKSFKREDGQDIEYYVLRKQLVDKTYLEVPIKSDKAKLLLLSLTVEKYNKN